MVIFSSGAGWPQAHCAISRTGRSQFGIVMSVHWHFAFGTRRIDIRCNQALVSIIIDSLDPETHIVDGDVLEQVLLDVAYEDLVFPVGRGSGAHDDRIPFQVLRGTRALPFELRIVARLAARNLRDQPAFQRSRLGFLHYDWGLRRER